MSVIRPERPHDADEIRAVHERAFAPSPGEARLVDLLRDAGDLELELCLVAVDDEQVVGHIAFSRAQVDSGDEVLALAPMAVLPEHQSQGIGESLVREALHRARATRFGLVVVLGHAAYYPRFGFGPASELGIVAPFEVPADAWMALKLPAYRPEARGVVTYADAFSAVT